MSVTSLKCPGCGAPIDGMSRTCEYCGVALVVADSGAAVLPSGLTAEKLAQSIVTSEAEFWKATSRILDSPYSPFSAGMRSRMARATGQQWMDHFAALDVGSQSFADAVEAFFRVAVLLPREGIAWGLALPGDVAAILTNYRLVMVSGQAVTLIPWPAFRSWTRESLEWVNATGEVRTAPELMGAYIATTELEPIRASRDWQSLSPLQEQLLATTRWGLSSGLGIDAPSLVRDGGKPAAWYWYWVTWGVLCVGAFVGWRVAESYPSSATMHRVQWLFAILTWVLPIVCVFWTARRPKRHERQGA